MQEERAAINLKVSSLVKTEAQVKALREGVTLTEAIERLLAAWVVGNLELPEPIEGKLEPTEVATVGVAAG
jgi:antitoxin component of RelBE/YafQ-DinJ toxin-antitoxin module